MIAPGIDSIARSRARAVFSSCRRYRYLLTRFLGPEEKTATFILLNPSTAGARSDDPTIRRCIGFARMWGCGSLRVVNLFGLRTPQPRRLRTVADPVGPENRAWVVAAVEQACNESDGLIVCGWGVHGSYREQDVRVMDLLVGRGARLFSFGITRSGHPRHPLYLPYAAQLVPFDSGLIPARAVLGGSGADAQL